jgi:hypothetical protein
MLFCKRCRGRVFIDRQYSSIQHMETYCVICGLRTFFHPPVESREGKWLLEKELFRAKHTITSL